MLARRNPVIIIVLAMLALVAFAAPNIADASSELPTTTTTTTTVAPTAAEVAAWNAAVKRAEIRRYIVAVQFQTLHRHHQAVLWRAFVAHLRAEAARRSSGRYVDGIEVCNGSTLPTCAIVKRESGFNPRAENPSSTASGLYQFIDGTWRSCGTGYGHASYAPVATQVSCARHIWDNGRGAGHWRL